MEQTPQAGRDAVALRLLGALGAGVFLLLALLEPLSFGSGLAMAVTAGLVVFRAELAFAFVLFLAPVFENYLSAPGFEAVLWAFFAAMTFRSLVVEEGVPAAARYLWPFSAFIALLILATVVVQPDVFNFSAGSALRSYPTSINAMVPSVHALALRQIITFIQSFLFFAWAVAARPDGKRAWAAVALSLTVVLWLVTWEFEWGDAGRRLRGTFTASPNALGNYLALALPVLFVRMDRGRPLQGLLVLWGAAALVLSGSLGATMGICVALFLAGFPRPWASRNGAWVVPTVSGVFVASMAALMALSKVWGMDAVAALIGGRLYIWWTAFLMAIREPLFGVGLGRFYASFSLTAPPAFADQPQIHAHNVFLHILAEAGIPAAACFLWVLHGVFRRIRPMNGDPCRRGLFLGVVAALVHNLGDYNLIITPVSVMFWGILGVLVGEGTRENGGASA